MNPLGPDDLTLLRAHVESIDAELVQILRRRVAVTDLISEYKIRQGLPCRDLEREQQHLESMLSMAPEKVHDSIRATYAALTDEVARRFEALGEQGSDD